VSARYACCDERRREAVRAHRTWNGIDYVEVTDGAEVPDCARQRSLRVGFLKPLYLATLQIDNVRIEGGERFHVAVRGLATSAEDPRVLRVDLDRPGDFSTYTLRLVGGSDRPEPPANFDPILSSIDFQFKVACPSDQDCKVTPICAELPGPAPLLDYLAKDYTSFRQLILERMAQTVPAWRDSNAADVGTTIVELLAYVGDYLSYQQDAVATEAYVETARRRVSLRRHLRLVDCSLDEGQNARAFVQIGVDVDSLSIPRSTPILSRVTGKGPRIAPASLDLEEALAQAPLVFETLHAARLWQSHNRLRFYTWGARECCLPRGATSAVLRGSHPELRPGAVLIFVEARGPTTGLPDDADPTRRCAVRLTQVTPGKDPLGGHFDADANDDPLPITEIEWGEDDALPFPLCISSRAGDSTFDDVSVALGNIVLCDHGETIAGEPLGSVPEAQLSWARAVHTHCLETTHVAVPPRFRPKLARQPLTHQAPYSEASPPRSARAALDAAGSAAPVLSLVSSIADRQLAWVARRDLLDSGPDAPHVVIELDSDESARLRFGDGRFGARPVPRSTFWATYKVGNGPLGNVGAQALGHVVLATPGVSTVQNPLPAVGGRAPESLDHGREHARTTFREQRRAVTPEDYAGAALRHSDVQRAVATFRWTGSWYTVFLNVDRRGGRAVDAGFRAELRALLERVRLAAHDVEIEGPIFVSLELELHVCVDDGHFRRDVRAALAQLFGRGREGGQRAFFHPDRLTFGQPVYQSEIVALAQGVAGVSAVRVVTLRRQGTHAAPPEDGVLRLARVEIARLDNDPNFPDHGVLVLELEGGK
jgi:hypothetical protein